MSDDQDTFTENAIVGKFVLNQGYIPWEKVKDCGLADGMGLTWPTTKETCFNSFLSYIFKCTALIGKIDSDRTMGKLLTLIEAAGLEQKQQNALNGLIKTFFKDMRKNVLDDLYSIFEECLIINGLPDKFITNNLQIAEEGLLTDWLDMERFEK